MAFKKFAACLTAALMLSTSICAQTTTNQSQTTSSEVSITTKDIPAQETQTDNEDATNATSTSDSKSTSTNTTSTTSTSDSKEKKVLSIEHAVELAINLDDKIPEYSRQIQLAKLRKDDCEDSGSLTFQNNQIYIDQYTTAKEYRKDTITKNVMSAYQNLILTQESIKLENTQIELAQKVLKQYEIKLEKGMLDQLTYDKQVQKIKDLNEELAKNQKTLTYLKSDFLKLTNIDVDKYAFEEDFSYEVFDLGTSPNINAYASGKAEELVKYQRRLAQTADSHFWDTIYEAGPGGTGPTYLQYMEGKINITDGLANVDSAYKNYKAAIEGLYTTASKDLNDLKLKESAYKTQENDLKPLEVKYKLGYVSTLDYEQAKVALDAARVDYLQTVYNYNIDKFQLEKPWVAS